MNPLSGFRSRTLAFVSFLGVALTFGIIHARTKATSTGGMVEAPISGSASAIEAEKQRPRERSPFQNEARFRLSNAREFKTIKLASAPIHALKSASSILSVPRMQPAPDIDLGILPVLEKLKPPDFLANPLLVRAVPLPQAAQPPNAPLLFSPSNGLTGASIPTSLDVSVSDPAGSNLTVTFYGRVASTPGPDFTIVALPDTQYYSATLEGGLPAMFTAQTQWIVNNRVADNIAFVIGLGDIVQHGNNGGNYLEWTNANASANLLDDPVATGLPQGIPYSFGVGNHDQGPSGDGSPDDTAGYNQYFGAARYSAKSYYGGHYGTDNDNHYELFSASGMEFIVINIAYMDPQYNGAELNSVLAWANNLLQTYSNRHGIVVSHYLINDGLNGTWSNQGQATYNALSANPNLFLMLCGHYTPPEGQRTDTLNGNTIYTLLSDYQEQGNGGNGYLRVMNFSPANNLISVSTYSPYVGLYRTGSLSQFTLSYNMQNSGYTALGTVSSVPSGSRASVVWNNLSPNTQYQWYAVVSNGSGSTTGPTWSFTTGAGTPAPVASLSSANLAYGTQQIDVTSAAQTVTLTNAGTAPLSITGIAASAQYAQTNTCGASVAAGGSCTISVTFTPTATGTQPGTITITDNALGSPQTVSLSGSGATSVSPAVSLSAASLAFGNSAAAVVQDASATGSGSSTLAAKFNSNVTKNNLLVAGVSSYAGNAFANPPVTDTLGSTWSLAVTKNPGTAGTPSLTAIYYAVAPAGGADTVTVHMTGTNNLHLHIYEVSGLLTSSALDQTGSNYQSGTTVATVSTAAATTSANEFVFAYFGRDNGSGAWAAGSGYGNTIASPNTSASTDAFSEAAVISAKGVQTATATSSAADGLTSVIATFAASAGGTPIGTTSAAQTVALTNTGSGSLSISSIVASGDFSETNTCGTFLAAAGSCTITASFTPTAIGTRAGAITITDNASNSPQSITLTGIGAAGTGPAVGLSATSVTFAGQTVNTTSAAQTITLSNPGSSAVNVSSIAAGAPFAQTNTCGTSVAAGGNCTISVTFTPTATGTQAGAVTITDNATGSPQTISLTGTGVAGAPTVSLSASSLSFGSEQINTTSAAQNVIVSNNGTAILSFTSVVASAQFGETNTCGTSLAAGSNCTVSVTFTPTTTGAVNGTITISDNAGGSPHVITLTGTGASVPVPAVTLSVTSLNFGSQQINTTSAAQTVTLRNTGTASLSVTSVATSAQYAQTNTCGTSVAAGGSCTISVTFTPTVTGTQTGTITITDNATGSPQTVSLTGAGVTSGTTTVTFSPTSLTFSPQQINTTSSSKSVRLTNTGSSTLTITSAAVTGPFTLSNGCAKSLAAGSSCSLSVRFNPTAVGTGSGTLTITDSATGSPQSVPLSGTGGNLTLSPTSLSFGTVSVNTKSPPQTATMTNLGTVAASISGISVSSRFAQTNTCGSSLAAGAHCTISVTFNPTATGSVTGSVSISDNVAGSPRRISLSGTGQ